MKTKTFLINQSQKKKKNQRENQKAFELNENRNTINQICDSGETEVNLYTNVYIRKQERSQNNDLSFYHKKLYKGRLN